jgi:glutamate racemase
MAFIVVYDSGVGGLTVYQEIAEKCPDHDIVFVSDNDAFPYGTKTEEQLSNRVLSVAKAIAVEYSPDVLVVACNTASTVVLPLLRKRFEFSVVGVVPAIKPAAQLSKSRHICMLATPGTIERSYTESLISDFAADCQVLRIGSSDLVQMAEDKLRGSALDLSKLNTILEPVIENNLIDVVVLACTHFPLLKSEISRIFTENNREVILLDSGSAVAQRVASIVLNSKVINNKDKKSLKGKRLAAFTKTLKNDSFKKYLSEYRFSDINFLSI